MSASSKLEDKEDLDPATITATPELKPLITDQRIDTFNKVKELQTKGISIKKISKVIGLCETCKFLNPISVLPFHLNEKPVSHPVN